MAKMWAGRFQKEESKDVNDFNSSISFDGVMFKDDIVGSMAHARMLGHKGIISKEDSSLIIKTLGEILADIEEGNLLLDPEAEDIHMFVEAELTKRIGEVGKRLHTARSRNDQVALDVRLYLRGLVDSILEKLNALLNTIIDLAEKNKETVMPGYTHLQRAQPITFANHLLAYAFMIKRDISRFIDAKDRMNYSPLGSCALAGTTYPIDREMVSEELGFKGIVMNSLDGVSDRDFTVELASASSIAMMHLSRFSEEIILWCSWEFKFIDLDDAYSTGSSIMPQKKNPDIAELVRGKTGRVYGDLITLLTMLKGIPLAYNKDMQEDKEAIFDALNTLDQCLKIFKPMLETIKVNKENMRNAAAKGFINATDLADYLVKKGMAFRSAYKISGSLVAYCIDNGIILEEVPLEVFKTYSSLFDNDVYEDINIEKCTFKRTSQGASAVESVDAQIKALRS
ncbi:argininosuccinate lyase [Anaeroplasma bactoclasticum]|jgi:argininosuccinate lyase|uniref:Argininosuccinate lyase n=1 Tax=Anaeroplasma bactoclasticum TaxID=2088 RepID=A0A397RVF1_9MOLU|nr:argininosuccinate lyase [Anaeroplasma bactoclasticum]RIA78320.1 argininosuccinate lyase [Anaeroplasma bactoclasticum]